MLRWADVPTLHELRISGKWLRYSLEFVEEPLGDDARPIIDKVTALQDHLGLMNDADIAAHLVLTHQAGMTNLLTRAGWEARVADASLRAAASPTPSQELCPVVAPVPAVCSAARLPAAAATVRTPAPTAAVVVAAVVVAAPPPARS